MIAAMVASCSPQPPKSKRELLAERAEVSVREALKDPDSAKFKDITASVQGNCIYGKLLAKNSYGAFTGYHDFVWINDRTYILNSDDPNPLGTDDGAKAFIDYHEQFSNCIGFTLKENQPETSKHIPNI
jgi:hypothetical protein